MEIFLNVNKIKYTIKCHHEKKITKILKTKYNYR